MCLRSQPIPLPPDETARVARAAFPHGNTYLRLRDELGTLFADDDFAALYPARGQPAEAPWRLALVTVLQFVENLSDRQAADAVRARIDWKYALGPGTHRPGVRQHRPVRVPLAPGRRWRGRTAPGSRPGSVANAAGSRPGAGSAPTPPTFWPAFEP